ncbi:hypothetical protein KAX02_08260 [candidate division WOR-3 bacterium]|nr:hypothetical protein [candidate division WOR-3 bacterium]
MIRLNDIGIQSYLPVGRQESTIENSKLKGRSPAFGGAIEEMMNVKCEMLNVRC